MGKWCKNECSFYLKKNSYNLTHKRFYSSSEQEKDNKEIFN